MSFAQRIGWLVPAACMAVLPSLVQAQGANSEGWAKYVIFAETECEAGEKADGKQVLVLKFDVVKEVPSGTKISFELEYLGSEVERKVHEVKGTSRTGIKMKWAPKKILAPPRTRPGRTTT